MYATLTHFLIQTLHICVRVVTSRIHDEENVVKCKRLRIPYSENLVSYSSVRAHYVQGLVNYVFRLILNWHYLL